MKCKKKDLSNLLDISSKILNETKSCNYTAMTV